MSVIVAFGRLHEELNFPGTGALETMCDHGQAAAWQEEGNFFWAGPGQEGWWDLFPCFFLAS